MSDIEIDRQWLAQRAAFAPILEPDAEDWPEPYFSPRKAPRLWEEPKEQE